MYMKTFGATKKLSQYSSIPLLLRKDVCVFEQTTCSFPSVLHLLRSKSTTMSMASGEGKTKCEFLKDEVMTSEQAKWLQLNKITYKDAKGKERLWECLSRKTTAAAGAEADAVAVIPVLKRTLMYDNLVCIRQYRPPLRAYTLEFPAGLIDAGESAEIAALRELKEETGYVATVKHRSPATALDPGAENCTLVMVSVEINGNDPVNIHPHQQQEETEDIEVILVPFDYLVDRLNEYSAAGVVIDSRLYSYAIAVAQARKEAPKEIPEDVE